MNVAVLACLAMTKTQVFGAMREVANLPLFRPHGEIVTTFEPVAPDISWNEAIVSWNVTRPNQVSLKIEAQAIFDDRATSWFTLAEWSGDLSTGSRRSVRNQKDADGEVQTDTLHLNEAARAIRLRVTQRQTNGDEASRFKLLAVSFSNTKAPERTESYRTAWGKSLDVLPLSQMPYESGALQYDPAKVSADFVKWFGAVKSAQYCSPTSTTMLLNFWASKANVPELKISVPDAVAGVFDENYPGTGNWPFNCAYMGSFDGVRSYVARLRGIDDLERLIDAGVPVVCSVAYNVLKGTGKAGGDGHIVVLIGFSPTGDPIFNDPGRSKEVRQVYRREAFRKAWAESNRTVYIAHPESLELPKALLPVVLS